MMLFKFRAIPVLLAVIFLCNLLLSACSEKEQLLVDIPEGLATDTLRDFARQTNVEILFDRQSVSGVETNAVKGNYDPAAALRIMLEDTPLGVDIESETGAYAVFRKDL